MDRTYPMRPQKPDFGEWQAELFVHMAMAFATLALGTALTLHAGLAFWVAGASALAVYFGLLAVHAVLKRRFAAGAAAAAEPGAGARYRGTPAEPPMPPKAQPNRTMAPEAVAGRAPDSITIDVKLPHPISVSTVGPAPKPAPAASQAPSQAPVPAPRATTHGPAPGGAHGPAPASVQAPSCPPFQATASSSGTTSPAPAGMPVSAPAPARPASPANAASGQASGMPRAQPAATAGSEIAATSPREADVEMIQALIKKLADEVNATEAVAAQAIHARRAQQTEQAIAQSVGALRSAADSMRSREEPAQAPQRASAPSNRLVPETAQVLAQSAPPRAVRPAIQEALEQGRVDVLLEPIHGLKDGRAAHFEVSLRLRDRSDLPIGIDRAAPSPEAAAAMPLIDSVCVTRSAQIALRLEMRQRPDQLFTEVSGPSIATDRFLTSVAEAYHQRESFAGRLVMAFAQADVRAFGEREWRTLGDLAELGFRFSMAGVGDLDMDFGELSARGFRFVKLDAGVFLEGLPCGDVRIPADDICRHLAQAGLTVIVGEIADEAVAARILGFGVLFGQGRLFGAPRAVKEEALKPAGPVAA